MHHPVGFYDSKKFIIKGKYVYYNSPGNSYLNKFMSNLKLEEKFKNDDDYEILCKICNTTSKNNEQQIKSNNLSKIIYEEPKEDFKFKKERKGKFENIKKRQCKNIKKHKIRQNGYDDKLHYISQHIIKPIQLLENADLEIEEYYLLNLNTDYKDYSDYYREDESYYDSEEEEERRLECAIERFKDMGSRW
jgi:hypothetical protein